MALINTGSSPKSLRPMKLKKPKAPKGTGAPKLSKGSKLPKVGGGAKVPKIPKLGSATKRGKSVKSDTMLQKLSKGEI